MLGILLASEIVDVATILRGVARGARPPYYLAAAAIRAVIAVGLSWWLLRSVRRRALPLRVRDFVRRSRWRLAAHEATAKFVAPGDRLLHAELVMPRIPSSRLQAIAITRQRVLLIDLVPLSLVPERLVWELSRERVEVATQRVPLGTYLTMRNAAGEQRRVFVPSGTNLEAIVDHLRAH